LVGAERPCADAEGRADPFGVERVGVAGLERRPDVAADDHDPDAEEEQHAVDREGAARLVGGAECLARSGLEAFLLAPLDPEGLDHPDAEQGFLDLGREATVRFPGTPEAHA